MGWEYGVGKKTDAGNGFAINAAKEFQNIAMNVGVAGTTDAGLKFGGSFTMSTDDELALNLYDSNGTEDGGKFLYKLKNTSADQAIKAAAYNVSGGQQVLGGSIVSVKINSAWHEAKTSVTELRHGVNELAADTAICKIAGKAVVADAPGAGQQTAFGNNGAVAPQITASIAKLPHAEVQVTRANAAGTKVASVTKLGVAASGYMAAGRLADETGRNWAGGSATAAANAAAAGHRAGFGTIPALAGMVASAANNADGVDDGILTASIATFKAAILSGGAPNKAQAVELTAQTVGGGDNIHVFLAADDDGGAAAGGALDADLFDVAIHEAVANGIDSHDDMLASDDVFVQNAAVYAGPFAEVKMTSSTTKMVIGAVCVTAYIMDSLTKDYL
jgi:hypothetical protein